jgi:diguanylate cyclase
MPASAPLGPTDTQSLAIDRFWRFARQGMLIAIGLHLAFAVAGWLAGALPLVALQAVSIAAYLISYLAAQRGVRWVPLVLAWLDLLGHATVACWIVGVASGFQYYSWIMLPLVFTNIHRSRKVKVALAAMLTVAYVAIDWWLHQTTPLIYVAPDALAALRYFNIACYLTALGMIAIVHTRTSNLAERQLNMLASTDVLTGLLNRRRMSDRLNQEQLKLHAKGGTLAVVLLDIDRFKEINDQYGHQSGDQVLATVGEVLRQTVRGHDLVARWGGEEFLVLLPGADATAARETAERIRSAIAAAKWPNGSVTVTAGVASWQSHESLETTLHRADTALYRGKNLGRNCVTVADAAPAEPQPLPWTGAYLRQTS